MDIKTLVLALALGNLSLCAALFFFEYERKKSLTLSIWAIAKQCQAAAWLLLYFRGILPDFFSIAVCNVVLFGGVALEAGALWEGTEHAHWRGAGLVLLGLAIALFLGAYAFELDPTLRVAASALIVSGFFLSGASALALGWRRASMLRRFLVVATAALALAVGARGILAALAPNGFAWIGNNLLDGACYGALYLLMLLNGFGFLLLAREQLHAELARLEVVDGMTDVPNRRGFFQALTPWMALARRPGLPTALIVLDIDHFKRVNDDYGHPAGDTVLRTLVEVCKKQLRDSDQLGRLGGAEFAVLLPRTAAPEALLVAERMRGAIAGMPIKAERAVINLSASLGVTTLRADDSTISLFKRADLALQAAKLAGRNQVVEAPPAGALDA